MAQTAATYPFTTVVMSLAFVLPPLDSSNSLLTLALPLALQSFVSAAEKNPPQPPPPELFNTEHPSGAALLLPRPAHTLHPDWGEADFTPFQSIII